MRHRWTMYPICLSSFVLFYMYVGQPYLFGKFKYGNHNESVSIRRPEPKLPITSDAKEGKGDAEGFYGTTQRMTTNGLLTKSNLRNRADSIKSSRPGVDERRDASRFHSLFMLGAGGWYTGSESSSARHPSRNTTKVVLAIQVPSWAFGAVNGTSAPFVGCAVPECFLTQDKRYLRDAHAVLFHLPTMPDAPPQLPGLRRPPGQRWIAFDMEPPTLSPRFIRLLHNKQWKSAFNWTMTYRTDSDFFAPYGMLSTVDPPTNKNYTHLALSKNKGAAWFVSHCFTPCRREEYARRLQRHYPLDIYGMCGSLKCPRNSSADCDRLLTRYRFYLAFENSLCNEYVTEKFFKIYRHNLDTIPVVRGGTDYKKNFPPGTFIDTADFASPEHLARYLHNLGKDTEAYAEMLREKDKYMTSYVRGSALCKLCEKLHFDRKAKTYLAMDEWFVKGSCKSPHDL